MQEARERQAQADNHLRQAQAPLREAFQLESEARRLERTLAERQELHRQSNQRHAQQSDAARQLDMEQQRHVAEQAQLQAALRDSQALAALGDAWATHQGQLAAFVQRRQRARKPGAAPELENPWPTPGNRSNACRRNGPPSMAASRTTWRHAWTNCAGRPIAWNDNKRSTRNGNRSSTNAPVWLDAWANLDQRMVEQEQALLDLKRQGSQCAEEVKAAEQALQVTRELLQRQRLARSASVEQLRAGLVDGEACPVCGSQEHPYHHSEQLLAALGEHDDQEQVRAEQSLERLRQTLAGLREGYSSQRERLNQSRQEQQELTGQLAALDRQLDQWTLPEELRLLQPSAQLEWLAQRLDDLAGQRQQCQRDFDRLIARQRQTQQLQQELRAAETILQQRQQALTEQRQRYEHLQQQVEEDSQQLRPLLSDEHWQRWQADPLRTFQALGESIEQRRQQQARLQQIEQRLQELKQRCDESSWQLKQSDEQRNEARQAEERAQAELAELNGRLGAHLGQHACAQDWQLSLEHAAQAAQSAVETLQAPWIRCARNNCDSPKPWNTCSSNGSANRMSSSAFRPTGRPGANARTTSTTAASTPCSAFPRNRRRNGGSNCSDCKRRSPASRHWKQSARRNCSSIAGSGRKPTARRWKTTCGNSANAWPPANRPTWIPTASCRPTTSAASRARRCLPNWSEARAEFRRWGRLNELIGSSSGDKFRRIAQGYNLDLLVQHSNVQLRQLARRYRLQRGGSELGLLVVDTEMGDELRSVYSLSGGETFLISLALALGLASMASSKLRIESLFIDEGFGSLDPESLQLAMDALDNLQAQGRKVAVISHVQEMHERIPVQVRVQREGNGDEQPEGGRLSRPPRRHVRTAARSVHPEHAAAALPFRPQMQHQPAEPAHLAPHCFLEHPGQAFHQAEPVAGAGDTGVHQLLGQHRVQRVRQDQRGMGELRTLRLVHGHGEHGVHLDQAARQDEAHAAATVVAREGHAQREAQAAVVVALGQAQGDADIAVHQPQAVVVARHQYRPPLVPAVIGLDQAKAQQFCRYPLVQSFHAPWAAAQRAEQAEGVESRQYRLRPALPGAILQRQSGGRAALGQAL